MAKIIQIHLWLKDKSEHWTEPEVTRPRTDKPMPGKRIVIEPHSDSLTEMKIQIAQELMRWRKTGRLKSYYVVVVVEQDNGDIRYRTIIPTTLVHE